jgi:hypothetical protein
VVGMETVVFGETDFVGSHLFRSFATFAA